jgi:hypothetical protein
VFNFCFYGEQYVARDPRKSSTVKDKSTYVLVPRQGDQNLSNKSSNIASSDGNQTFDENGEVDFFFFNNFSSAIFSVLFGFYFVVCNQHFI